MSVGMKLDAYLKEHGITQRVFADQIGCEQPTVARFATGGRIPSPELMRLIAERTNGAVTPNDFFDVTRPAPAPVDTRASVAVTA